MPPLEPLILLTNDDGVDAPGIRALEGALAPLGRLVTVAPLTEQSASSRRITLRRPIRYERRGEGRFGVDGTPADSVMMAVTLLLEEAPALVVSGINSGPNLGENIYYSGTVGAAAEGAKYGFPAMAVSVNQRGFVDYGPAAEVAATLAAWILAEGSRPGVVLNVNVPAGRPAGFAATRQCGKISRNYMVEARDPYGRPYYWMHEDVPFEDAEEGSDYAAVREGLVSVTPLQFDHTADSALAALREALPRATPAAP